MCIGNLFEDKRWHSTRGLFPYLRYMAGIIFIRNSAPRRRKNYYYRIFQCLSIIRICSYTCRFIHVEDMCVDVRLFISAFMYISMSLIFYSCLRQSLNCSSKLHLIFLIIIIVVASFKFGSLGRMNRPNHGMNNDVLHRMGGDSHRIRQERPWIVAKAVRLSSWIFSLFENKRNETMQVVSLARHAGATTSCYHATRARSTSIEWEKMRAREEERKRKRERNREHERALNL